MANNQFDEFLNFIKGKKILITTHDLVDLDGFVSCFVLKLLLDNIFSNLEISIFFSELSKSTRNFMERFIGKFPEITFNYINDVDLSKYDLCLVLDTNNLKQLAFKDNLTLSDLNLPYISIDHHYYNQNQNHVEKLNLLNIINENFSSTIEIILELFEYNDKKLPTAYRYLIIAAILADSGFFKYANNNTLKHVSKLIDDDINFQEILLLLEDEIDISKKIANIKGLQRVKLIRKGSYLIGVSRVSSFGASVASVLIKIGFDVSIVHSQEKGEFVINTRANKNLCLKTGLHLGKILGDISNRYKGSGGGHDGAASLTLTEDLDVILDEILKKITQVL
ncbi:MAG: bifunctional oligoribonuclease/PAP phosphatase NrnA [Promethearchaeota archaeon]